MFSFLKKQQPSREKVIAYIDESYDQAVFVAAGFAAPADQWEKFSVAWRNALAAPPPIRALKTNEAMALKGHFHKWSETERDSKLVALYDVIDTHVSFAISAMVPIAHLAMFNDSRLNKAARNPYLHAFSQIIGEVARYQYQNNTDFQVEFVFDERLTEQGKLLDVWEAIVEDAPPDIKSQLDAPPTWAKDDEVLPLQAADLEAWWLRRRWLEKLNGFDRLEYPWLPANIPELACVHTEQTLTEVRDRMSKAVDDLERLTEMMKDPPKF
jgi:hypothetical protein